MLLSECEQMLLDELSWRQRSVFLYSFILKMPQKEIAKHLKINSKFINDTIKYLNAQIDFMPIKEEILEAFNLNR